METLHLGQRGRGKVAWSFERVAETFRLCLLNNDESGSMEGQLPQNALAFDKVAALLGGEADVVVVHGFGSDSAYSVYAVPALVPIFGRIFAGVGVEGSVSQVPSRRAAVEAARAYLRVRTTHGSTCPRTHPEFLGRLAAALDAHDGEFELTVVSTSDGGFDGGAPQREIQERMARLTSRCRAKLAVNVLVGSAGSPSALHFFTGDPDAFDQRLLFTTTGKAAEGVLVLATFDPRAVPVADVREDRFTMRPSTPFWSFQPEREELLVYFPEGVAPIPSLELRRHQPQPGGREVVTVSKISLQSAPVGLDGDAREVFGVIARSLSDNPYIRDESRRSLNGLMAQLEQLLGTRTEVLRTLSAPPEGRAQLELLRTRLDQNLGQVRAVTGDASLSIRERSARINALNNARRLLKDELRTTQETLDQQAIEAELAVLASHPDHWVTWLMPALDELKAQLSLTQQDVGGAMQHLSTRIRTKKSREDGQTRAVDRHVEALLERSRARHDRAERAPDPAFYSPFEQPGAWLFARCPISGAPLDQGLAGLPFVADRSDLTSGNVAAGGQNVDRMPVAREAILSMRAVRGLMWGPNGQMASPYCTGSGVYNAAIPVLLGPATPALILELQKAIGWLSTGTSAFEPAMAEAIPGALAMVLGALDAAADGGALDADRQAHALLRTTALFDQLRSYPYVAGTAVLDETAAKIPLTEVWAKSVAGSAGAACLQSSGCATSLFAKVVGAAAVDVAAVARDLFSWACRNVARSILGVEGRDGRGGVEGVRRLAALLRHDVELAGYPAGAPVTAAAWRAAADVAAPGRLSPASVAAILGEELLPLWDLARPVGRADFTEALNAWLSGLPPEQTMFAIDRLAGVFERFDLLAPPPPIAAGAAPLDVAPVSAVRIEATTHAHFDILALEAVRPVRSATEVPGLADGTLALRRVLKAGATAWVPPRDARLPAGQINGSALRFLNEHSALAPLRALLRLDAAGCLGHPALAALRRSAEARPFPRVDDAIGALAAKIGGMDEVLLLAHRALAFVVADANGYADKHWAEAPLRVAGLADAEVVLGLTPAAPIADAPPPRRYGPAPLALSGGSGNWPRLIGRGYLPKSRAIDHAGKTIGEPIRCAPEDSQLSDLLLCQKACAALLARLTTDGVLILGGLHREARGVLGGYPEDLRTLDPGERTRVLVEELVPRLAGRVGGDVQHPEFFQDCASVLLQMIALGEDTRTFAAKEPADIIEQEARDIRARSGAAG